MQRMSPGVLIVGVFAILIGLVAAYGVKSYLSRPPVVPPEAPRVDRRQVPVAVADLPVGRTIAETDVAVMSMTAQEAAVAKLPPVYMSSVKQIVGRTLKQPVKRGLTFDPAFFYPEGTGPDIAESLQPGERAVTIPFRNNAVDSSFVTPGAVVDVLFRTIPSGADVPDATVTLLSRVRILAVGPNTFPGTVSKDKDTATAERQPTVTLAVNQTQARAVKVADGRGTFTLVLRNPKDESLADKGGPTTMPGLLGMKEPQRPSVVENYRAGNRSVMTFAEGLRQKIQLDPPYGLPVVRKGKDDKAEETIEVWPGGWGWGGWDGWGANWTQGAHGTRPSPRSGVGGWGGWGGYGGYGGPY